ncbi:hypothetical protein [Brevibacterium otitidis]|uniref:Nucleotide exchange factor GrpE n=1 Tax=Brevibacterium otitidis TaxID=53364 RepID=A0ABV5X1I6_9MICO|nr:hypothetical protein GCM10023233_14260 [Brevibacterium otitidis]
MSDSTSEPADTGRADTTSEETAQAEQKQGADKDSAKPAEQPDLASEVEKW